VLIVEIDLPLSPLEARFDWVFRKEGLEILVLIGFPTLFAEIIFRNNFKAERVAEGRVSRVWVDLFNSFHFNFQCQVP
jgi:hypothetical protein